MDPFRSPTDPFGVPGDSMEEVLSLQTYGGASFDGGEDDIILTYQCTISCPTKPPAPGGS